MNSKTCDFCGSKENVHMTTQAGVMLDLCNKCHPTPVVLTNKVGPKITLEQVCRVVAHLEYQNLVAFERLAA